MQKYVVEAIDRRTEQTVVADYATFDTYEEARAFADRYEHEARACGWTYVVRLKERAAMTAGYLQLDGWAGRTQQRVEVVGRTAKRVRIKALGLTRLAGRRRWLAAGETALVPAHAVTDAPRPGVEMPA
jgi:hypothetical protein